MSDRLRQSGPRATRTKRPDAKRGVGRPSDFLPEYAEQARKLCLLGSTDKELAEFFQISESTLNLWKLKHAVFSESIRAGKVVADAEVAASAFQSACGFTRKVQKAIPANEKRAEQVLEWEEYFPPNPQAQRLWLINRSAHWRDKQQLEHTGKDGQPLLAEQMSAEDLRRLARERGLLTTTTTK